MDRPEGEEVLTMETLVTALPEVGKVRPAPPGDRYRLKPPIFGDDDVKQFIREFEDVVTIAEWTAPGRLFQLRPWREKMNVILQKDGKWYMCHWITIVILEHEFLEVKLTYVLLDIQCLVKPVW